MSYEILTYGNSFQILPTDVKERKKRQVIRIENRENQTLKMAHVDRVLEN